MGWFVWGLLAGLVGALIVSAVVGYILFRRIQRLQVRAKRAERLAELETKNKKRDSTTRPNIRQ